MGYAKLRPRPTNGNPHGSVLKPVTKKKSHIAVWVGVPLLLLVAVGAAFSLVYMRNSKIGQSTETSFVVGTEIVNGIEWKYRVSHGKAEIGNGSTAAIKKSTTGAITIPFKLGGYPVTGIGERAFHDCRGLTSVAIPDSVTRIGNSVFSGCSGLKSVTIPDSVTGIGTFAFSGCERLRSVAIPDSVTSIGRGAFSHCSGLKSILVAVENKNYKSVNGLLLSKDGKTLIQGVNGDVTIPDSVTSVGAMAFSGRGGLTSVTIPNSVTSIGDQAFSDCSALQSVRIPNSVTSIEDGAFGGCIALQRVTIPNSVTSIGERAFGACKDSLFDTKIHGVKLVDGWAVDHADSLFGNLDLTGVRGIGVGAFKGCDMLGSVMIPDSVTSIGERAFCQCSGLKSIFVSAGNKNYKSVNGLLLSKDGKTLIQGVNGDVTIPDSVTSIGDHAFSGCDRLRRVMIPDSVMCIGDRAFYHCVGLKSFEVDFGNVNFKVVSGMLLTKDGKTLVSAPGEINGSVVIPDSVTHIGPAAFSGCRGLTSVTIPNGVTSIGDSAFSGCSGLTSVTIPNGVTSIGDYAFSWCRGLTNVTIPDSVTSIGKRAFSICSSLMGIRLPRRFEEELDRSVFDGCSEDMVITYYGWRAQWLLWVILFSVALGVVGYFSGKKKNETTREKSLCERKT